MKTGILSFAIIAGLSFSMTASAAFDGQEVELKSDVAANQLAQNDWSAAEHALLQGEVEKKDAVFAKLNLAYLYSSTGRIEKAAALYQEVLDGRDNSFAMTLSGNPRKVKYIAADGLKRLSSLQ